MISPPFGVPYILSMSLAYDRWYYDVDSGNSFRVEATNDAGQSWILLEELIYGDGGWVTVPVDLFALFAPTDEIMLRFVVEDAGRKYVVRVGDDIPIHQVMRFNELAASRAAAAASLTEPATISVPRDPVVWPNPSSRVVSTITSMRSGSIIPDSSGL